MDTTNLPAGIYTQEKEKQEGILAQLLKKQNLLGWMRLLIFIVTTFVAYKIFVSTGAWGWIAVAVGFAFFLVIVSFDVNNKQKIAHVRRLIQLNEEELEILKGDYINRFDGSNFIPEAHPYANDFDLFGKASLFQYMNRCYTEQGKKLLATNLLYPLPVDDIQLRHEAIMEITPQHSWRQECAALAMQTPVTIATEKKIEAWLQQDENYFTGSRWKAGVTIYAMLTVGSVIATILGVIPSGLFSALYILYLIISSVISRKAAANYAQLTGIAKEVATLFNLMQWMETASFKSVLLKNLQNEVKVDNEQASLQIKRLKIILDRFDLGNSLFGLFGLNTFLLWNVRQSIALHQWKQRNKHQVAKWFTLIAETEVLNSLATLHFNQPDWCVPQFKDTGFYLNGQKIGHPLIPAPQRINNNFTLEGASKIGLITGSNMAGKSTFLRSLGVNMVLAQMGAPVCAQVFVMSPVHIMSSMRIADNLAENTSTFYAELKKLKTIIEAVNRHEPVFILLDEILRGTNSLDRHTGSKALMQQLIKEGATAVIATHDVELAALEQRFPQSIENYHFDVQVAGEELYFDYKLKEGVCTSLNASILMKKIGIELS